MLFLTPARCTTSTGAADALRCIMPNPLNSLPAVGPFDLSAIRFDHATVGVLSEKTREDRCVISVCCSSTLNCNSTAACSRSEFVIDPLGFFSDTTCDTTSAGKSIFHTRGAMSLAPENHTPPAPVVHASIYPI